MKIQIQLLLIALSFAAVFSQERQVYCGRRLALMIDYICNKEDVIEKRANYYPHQNSLQLDSWWITPQKAMAMERGKRQVATECCDKPCSIYEMLAYCP